MLIRGNIAMQFKDYYQILGVEKSARPEEIKQRFRTLARQYHPDINKAPESEARFKEISEANDVLGDTTKRAEYDQLHAQWQSGGNPYVRMGAGNAGYPGQNDALNQAFERMFRSFFDGRETQDPLSDLFGRSGAHPGRAGRASVFTGKSGHPFGTPTVQILRLSLPEAFQGGRHSVLLRTADGRQSHIAITIPPGVTDGQTLHLAAKGAADLHIEIRIEPHPLFRIEGRDIHLDLPIAPWEAALGASVIVPTLGGPVRLKILPESQAVQVLALKGRGLPGNPAGHQYVKLVIVTPTPHTEPEKTLYRHMEQMFSFDPRAGMKV
jgi:curved DNA-binding protein